MVNVGLFLLVVFPRSTPCPGGRGDVGGVGGVLGYVLGGYVPPRSPNLDPRFRNNFPSK